MGSVVHTQQLFDLSLLLKVLQVAVPEHFTSQSQSVDTVDSNCTLRSSSSRTNTSKGLSKWRMLWLTSGWWIICGKVMKDLLQQVGGDELAVEVQLGLNPFTFAASGCSERCELMYRLKERPPLTASSWMMSEFWPATREDIMCIRPPSCCTSNLKVAWIYGHRQHVWLLTVKSEQPHPASTSVSYMKTEEIARNKHSSTRVESFSPFCR